MPTRYVNASTGANTGSALTPETAWRTLTYAEANVVGGDHIYCTGTFTETWTLTFAAGSGVNSLIFEGYDTTPGDGGRAIIDGESTRANCLTTAAHRAYRIFKNWELKNATAIALSCAAQTNTWFHNFVVSGGTTGVSLGSSCHLTHGLFQNSSSSHTVTHAGNGVHLGSAFVSSAANCTNQSSVGNLLALWCLFVNPASANNGVSAVGGSTATSILVNNVFDGRNNASRRSFLTATPIAGNTLFNNIFARGQYGVYTSSTGQDSSRQWVFRRTMFSEITSKYLNNIGNDTYADLFTNEVNQSPAWVDAPNLDYTPAADASNQVAAGLDQQTNKDIGPVQRRTAGGAPGGTHIKRPKILDGGMTS